ncbi:ABC transporter ATP-binding protein [Pedomonas mirosovicensis]|uniref:ABC transporter ATP-binding protein n=1 Tax=Pedomonas mirosovicensis TaxID=2908641 RepID=UPI00216994A1|nr:ABC transporter ATP-binding protein [Pedomonas mirosovicensis]MCH8685820.1 ABC transporter ATP-binding protein [Pedomonas mirosovicensis]
MIVEANGLAKRYGQIQALKPTSFSIPPGRIVGIIGPNGAGKSTLVNALLGLINHEGSLRVLDRDPLKDRASLMHEVSYIADVATLPRWIRVKDLLSIVEGIHPRFDRRKAEDRLARTTVRPTARVRELSKGMIVQLHLAIVLSIDARLLVLDEPTLGLDLINRRSFYDAILSDFFDETRSIIVTTHQVEEIEHVLTHVMMMRQGEVVLDASIDELSERFAAVDVPDSRKAEAEALRPVYSRRAIGRTSYVFDSAPQDRLAALGEPRRVSLADLFVATVQPKGEAE